MCRFVVYHGPEIPLADLITRPHNSIIHQSYDAKLREPLNGDGFGMAWYSPGQSETPSLYRSISPAWADQNLADLAEVLTSGSILAHVRAASPGLPVVQTNCHPFRWGKLSFMHNGYIPDFLPVRREILRRVSDEAFEMIGGTTDSEHVFGLFVDHIRKGVGLAGAMDATLQELREITGERTSLLNLAVSDGSEAVVCRATLGPDQHLTNTLFVHHGMQYICDGAECRMVDPGGDGTAVLVASEPLSDDPGWQAVPPNHRVQVLGSHVEVTPLPL